MICNNDLLFRLRRPAVTHARHTVALPVSVGYTGRQVLRSCRSTLLGRRRQCSRERRHQRRAHVQSEREVTLSAQSQVSTTVSTVSRRTGQLWTATCPQCHRGRTRFVDESEHTNTYKHRNVGPDRLYKVIVGTVVYDFVS